MNTEEICEELTRISSAEIRALEQLLPEDAESCFILFTEMTRVSDYWGLGQNYTSEDASATVQTLDIMKMGWNLAASYLYKVPQTNGFPFHESTDSTRRHAANLLYKFGCLNLLKRTQDMLKADILAMEVKGDKYIFRKKGHSSSQYLDQLEFENLDNLAAKIETSLDEVYGSWNLVERKHVPDALMRVGNFLSLESSIWQTIF